MKTKFIRAILIVDDEPSLAGMLKLHLEKEGFTVQTAGHGRQALDLLKDFKPELIITDIFMAEMDGLEVITAVKQRLPGIKIIAMSGDVPASFTSFLPVAQKLGAHRTLAKPVEFPALLDLILELDNELAQPGSQTKG